MDENMVLMMEILDNLREKYKKYNQIYLFTKQLEDVIGMNDEFSLASTLEARERVMLLVDELDDKNQRLINQLADPMQIKVLSILFPHSGETLKLDNPLETNLFDTNKSNVALLNRIVALDKKLNSAMNNRPAKGYERRG